MSRGRAIVLTIGAVVIGSVTGILAVSAASGESLTGMASGDDPCAPDDGGDDESAGSSATSSPYGSFDAGGTMTDITGDGFPGGQGRMTTVGSSSELEQAVQSASPGDTIRLQSGTYSGDLTISNSGAANRPITITSQASDASNYAVIDGGNNPGDGGACMHIDGASWIVVKNLRFQNCWDTAIEANDASYITVHGVDVPTASYVVRDSDQSSHHILIQNSHWKPAGDALWADWTWNAIKKGDKDYLAQSSILGPDIGGAAVIRGNHIEYTFNAFRTKNAVNTEVYGNDIHHVRDNAIEPESYLYNFHVYHNRFNQIDPGMFSVDSDKGGLMYLYGNIGHYDHSDRSRRYKRTDVAGHIFKLVTTRDRYLSEPMYVVHNSFHNYRLAFKPGRYQKNIKHFNNAYNLNQGMGFGDWGDWLDRGNEFDYDAAANGWADELESHGHEQNGLKGVDPRFRDPANGDFQLQQGSQLIDAGTEVDGFTQSYDGSAPDIGAYEGDQLVQGPPFRILEPDGGLPYSERPRITRHYVDGSTITAFYSTPLDASTVNANNLQLYADGTPVSISRAQVSGNGHKLTLSMNRQLASAKLDLCYDSPPRGTNGQEATYWASTLGCNIDR